MKLPGTIEEVVVRAGRVRVRTTPRVFEQRLSLSVGDLDSAFVPLADTFETGDRERFVADFPLGGGPAIDEAAEREGGARLPLDAVGETGLNALPDWSLANGETLHLRLYDRNRPLDLALNRALTLPPRQVPLVFRAAIAAHRARADLCLEIAGNGNGAVQTETVSFDPARTGGRFRSGYQEVAIEIPPSRSESRLTLRLVYRAYRATDEDNDPYLFLADPEVTPRHWAPQTLTAVRQRGGPVAGARWFEAEIPQPYLSGAAPVQLWAGTDRVTVFEPAEGAVTLVENRGHGLVMRAERAARYSFFLDGAPAFAAHVGAGPTEVRIPTAQLTGGSRHLTVRDASGTQLFLETYVLLPRILTPEDVLQRVSKAPFPGPLSGRASHRYEALKAHLQNPGSPAEMAQLAHALKVLEGGYDNVRLEPLRFARPEAPEVSVVIPAHDKVAVTYYALCALLLARNAASFEVIVVDDASTDETARLEQIVDGITVIHNPEPQRFIRACNAGVAAARGRYVVLLNNDTEPTPGWLDALIDAFRRFPRVGLAGAKLLYPDGKLQDAGGIVWGSGNPWNYGNRQNPWDPRFCYARQADYLSGAAMMTTREIWDRVGGLSSYLEPMYFEDTDFAFKVREAGHTTWFVPSSVVYHFEGLTSGTDTGSGFKQYQEVNRPKFKRRWAKAFAGFGPEGQDPDLEKDRGIVGRVLFVDYTTPCPDQDAGSYAAVQEMKLVRSLGYKVTFVPQNLAHLGVYTEELERDGVEVVTAPFCLSLEDFLDKRGAEFDAVYITRYYVGQAVIDKIRQAAPRAKVLFNTADLHFMRQLRTAIVHKDPKALEAARAVRAEELEVIRKTDVVLSYNEVENAVIDSHTDGAVKVVKCPWVVAVPDEVPGHGDRAGLSFLGSFNHHPNGEGLTWFVREVMPLLTLRAQGGAGSGAGKPGRARKADPAAAPLKLSVYGANMSDPIRALAGDTVDIVGYVEDVAEAYGRHRVFVAPLLSGAGIKGKVIAALAHGIPCVLSPVAAEGVGLRSGHDCLIAATPQDWVEAVLRAHDDAALWQTLSDNARAYVRENFSFDTGRARMRAAFEAVDLFGSLD